MKKVTLLDIAEQAQVSPAAVSRYINKSGYVSEEKSARIKAVMDQLQYFPVPQSRSNGILCLISFGVTTHSFYQLLWATFICEAQRIGKSLLILTDNAVNNATLPALVEKAMRNRPEGLIITGFLDDAISEENIALLKNLPIPVVAFERSGFCQDINSVTFDERRIMENAVDYLAKLGHRRIGFLGVNPTYDVEIARLEGYRSGLALRNLPYESRLVELCADYTQIQGRHAMQKLLSNSRGITAVIVCSDLLSAGALQAISENHLQVPEDISIISHDDVYAKFMSPPLSSILYPIDEAVKSVLSIIQQHADKPQSAPVVTTKLGLSITHRTSVKRLDS